MKIRSAYGVLTTVLAISISAQVTPAPAPVDDAPSVRVGGVIYADYTYQQSPKTIDADKNEVNASSFNVSRAYINITGQLNHMIAFRITPDIARESGTGSSLSGSQTFRLKYAYGQLNLDDWTTKGSWVRLGIQQTPYIDYTETLYRYRFQGTIFVDREAFLSAADAGVSGHYNFPGNYGDVHAGFYNGETYARPELNDQKAFQVRASLRPMPLAPVWKGLRVTGFVDEDHYVRDAKRERMIGQVSFEHPRGTAALELFRGKDQTLSAVAGVNSRGYSIWATPKLGTKGFEALLRHDELKPSTGTSQKRMRNILGVAYWVPKLNKVTAALMLDYDSLKQSGFSPSRADDTRFGVKMLVSF